ncbi:hypothetical protein ASG17_14015 [Brevundimonas sp. Leaf363]|nr:hypothetical protein ASG17_14015 [Brevundimonas sp. Leaf363]
MGRPGAWLDAEGGGYGLRLGGDRRARVVVTLDEAAFRALVERPGLRVRNGGGWTGRNAPEPAAAPAPGRPGHIEGQRAVMQADGRLALRPANMGETPIAWLLRRKDRYGRPWLTPAQGVAGERLSRDAEIALSGPSLTMRWDALPRAGGGSSAVAEPGDRTLAAARRVAAALGACPPQTRLMLDSICVRGRSMQLAEGRLGLRRRQGRAVLIQGLDALAKHYGLGGAASR